VNIDPDKLFYYYITLYYGEDSNPQAFILDTTSALISSPCNLCATCGYHSNEWYNITNEEDQILKCSNSKCNELSGTCQGEQCSYQFDYYENAYIKGIFVNETIRFHENSSKAYNIIVGCTLKETNYIIAQDSDGIMGLNNDKNSFINTLYKSQMIEQNLFSICLSQDNHGYFSLGNIYTEYHSSSTISYIPFTVDEEKYYNVKIKSFEVGEQTINFDGSAIIDTTASLSSFPNNLFESIVKVFEEKCPEESCGKLTKNRNFGVCAVFDQRDEMITKIKKWLNIKIVFNEYTFEWKPENYWVNISTSHNFRACLGFESTDEDVITLGTTFLHGYDVIFDRENNKIGFAESDCNGKFDYQNKNERNINVREIKKSNEESKIISTTTKEHETKMEAKGRNNFSISLKIIFLVLIIISIIVAIIYFSLKNKRKIEKYKKIRAIKDIEFKNLVRKNKNKNKK
jgi:hypothetical protein